MALAASDELPIIDFSKEAMKPGTETWDLTREHVRKALEEYGYFKATFSEINNELNSTAVLSSLEKLFDLPKHTKRGFTSDGPLRLGYISDLPQIPHYESMGFSDPLSFETIHNLSLCMWPQGGASNFCEILHSYVMRASKLEETVRKMIFQSYGMEGLFEVESQSMEYLVRLLKYGPPMTEGPTLGVNAHYDMSFLTILMTDGVGLQVRNKDGEWISPTISNSSLIVMIGQSFHGWSNGRLRCPLHVVKMSGTKSRYTISLFSYKKGTVEIPNELIDEQHPQLYKPFDHDALYYLCLAHRNVDFWGDGDNIVPTLATHFAI